MAIVLLVSGTREPFGEGNPWWRKDSPFARALHLAGHELAAPDDPFSWTGDYDGALGHNRTWEHAGDALSWWMRLYTPDAIIAFSHGGQVAAIALSRLPVSKSRSIALVTAGTPVRKELADVYRDARQRVNSWRHLRSDRTDFYQRWGSLSWWDWVRPWRWSFERDMQYADGNVFVPGVGHAGLLDPELWTTRDWWAWLTKPAPAIVPPTAPAPATALEAKTEP